jgi:hypothetical protein
MQPNTSIECGEQAVVDWRQEQLVAAGFPVSLSVRLAEHPGYDVHELIGLVEHGCEPRLAARILAPDDD